MPSRQALSLFKIAIGILCLCMSTPAAVAQPVASSDASAKKWPRPIALVKQLETMESDPLTGHWASEMLQLLDILQTHAAITDVNTQQVIRQIHGRRQAIDALMESAFQQNGVSPADIERVVTLQRIGYEIDRRLAVWIPLQRQAALLTNTADNGLQTPSPFQLASTQQFSFGITPAAWINYLAPDDTLSALESPMTDAETRELAARRVLARLHSPALDANQRTWLNQIIPAELTNQLQDMATHEVDAYRMLALLEIYEGTGSAVAASRLNNEYQNLFWSRDVGDQAVARQIDMHYRNANARIAINQRLLNAFMPKLSPSSEPISESVMGARVSGQSRITNQVQIGLVPDPQNIHLQLETTGHVTSNLSACKKGFTVQNHGNADFRVLKSVRFTPFTVESDLPVSTAQLSQRTVGLSGKHDHIPVLGWLTRKIARQEIAKHEPRSERLMREKIESTATERVEQEVSTQLHDIRQFLNDSVRQPLVSIELEPEIVDMSTTSQQIISRYRLAGRDQLAAHTARPVDRPTDLVSLQLHQSAINNLIQRMGLDGETFDATSLRTQLESVIGIATASDEIAGDATFRFAKNGGVQVRFHNGEIQIELRLASLQLGRGKTWRNLVIQTTYVPTYYGMRLVLVQKDGIELSGKRLKLGDQIAIRAAFKVVLEPDYSLSIMPRALETRLGSDAIGIDRLSIVDGWFGIAINENLNFRPGVDKTLAAEPSAIRFR